MCILLTEIAITTLLRETSSRVYFSDFAYISRTFIFQNICSISLCTCGLQEKTAAKSTVESVAFKVTVLY